MTDQESQASSELASFGEELRREREIRGISLKEIADATKISKRFLEAIERNDHNTLPAPVFTRGFVREYARYLGLNAEEMVNRYNFAAARDERIEKPKLAPVTQPPPPPVRERVTPKQGIPPPYARVDRNIVILIFLAAALAGVIYWAVRHRRDKAEAAEASVHVATPPAVAATTHPRPAVAATIPTATAGSTSTTADSNGNALHLTLELVDNSWVTLEVDGKTVVSDELKKGERHTYDAKDRFRFKTIGNAAGVALTLNDTKIPTLGAEGKVLHDRVFDRDYLQKAVAESPRSEP